MKLVCAPILEKCSVMICVFVSLAGFSVDVLCCFVFFLLYSEVCGWADSLRQQLETQQSSILLHQALHKGPAQMPRRCQKILSSCGSAPGSSWDSFSLIVLWFSCVSLTRDFLCVFKTVFHLRCSPCHVTPS